MPLPFANDAAELMADPNRRPSEVRLPKSRARAWRRRIENKIHRQIDARSVEEMDELALRQHTAKELTRIGDLLAVFIGVLAFDLLEL